MKFVLWSKKSSRTRVIVGYASTQSQLAMQTRSRLKTSTHFKVALWLAGFPHFNVLNPPQQTWEKKKTHLNCIDPLWHNSHTLSFHPINHNIPPDSQGHMERGVNVWCPGAGRLWPQQRLPPWHQGHLHPWWLQGLQRQQVRPGWRPLPPGRGHQEVVSAATANFW